VLTVVTGPPCSGKSTYAWSRAQPGDIVIDFDRIAQAIGSGDPHDHPNPVRWTAIAMRKAGITAAIEQHRRGATVWIVQTTIAPADMLRYVNVGAEVVALDVDSAELHRRADAERPAKWHDLIDRWTPTSIPARTPAPRRSSVDSGKGRSGRPWRRLRAQILGDSDVCWWCGHGGADAVDHVIPLSRGGPPLDPANLRPIHGVAGCPHPGCGLRCNSVRGDRLSPPRSDAARSRSW
jgi:hypothetical protein